MMECWLLVPGTPRLWLSTLVGAASGCKEHLILHGFREGTVVPECDSWLSRGCWDRGSMSCTAFLQMVTEDRGGRWSSANPDKGSRASGGPYHCQWVHSLVVPGTGAGLCLQVGTTSLSWSGEVCLEGLILRSA